MEDVFLKKWGNILLVLALVTLAVSIVTPLSIFFHDSPLILTRGTEVWSKNIYDVPRLDAVLLILILLIPQLFWMNGVFQVLKIAMNYKKGLIFDKENTYCFIKLGRSVFIMGILNILSYPAANTFLYLRGISPWLGDMPLLGFLQPDLLMAGAFFFILGKIMHHGLELQEAERLTV